MVVLREGAKGIEVRKLQIMLNRALGGAVSIYADGHFGKKTKDALIQFQKMKNLTPDGIAGGKTFSALGYKATAKADSEPANTEFVNPWFDIVKAEMGVSENSTPGKDNARIIEYHATTTLKAKHDEVPWCSSFVNWVMVQAGYKGTDNALAKSWATWGVPVTTPVIGDIVVIKRKSKSSDSATGSSTGYHVAFFIAKSSSSITLIGGNQGDKVKRSNFYLRSYEVVAYRRPNLKLYGLPPAGIYKHSNTLIA